ncbi:hypothetical protein Tco_0707727 [Tanacetum coccineum]
MLRATRGTESGEERFKKFAKQLGRRWWGAPLLQPILTNIDRTKHSLDNEISPHGSLRILHNHGVLSTRRAKTDPEFRVKCFRDFLVSRVFLDEGFSCLER